MAIFYVLALIPVAIGMILWIKSNEVVWGEWLSASALAFIVAGSVHLYAIKSQTGDRETWSGQVSQVEYHPRWVEQYEESHTRTVGSGKNQRTETYYTTEYATHEEHWEAERDFGGDSDHVNIDLSEYNQIKNDFGGAVQSEGKQSTRHGGHRHTGDNSIYVTHNRTGVIWPVTTWKTFENRIKAAPSVFSFVKPPTGTVVFPYPENTSLFVSDRVIGQAKSYINLNKWDQLNSRLGPTKRVNLIAVGFDSNDSQLSQAQESMWLGGRKNDLVLTFGIKDKKVQWARVFGWTESDICKRNIETIILGQLGTPTFLTSLEREVANNFKKKDWHKFDYISIQPTTGHIIFFIVTTIITQTGLYIYFFFNDISKSSITSSYGYGSRYRRW